MFFIFATQYNILYNLLRDTTWKTNDIHGGPWTFLSHMVVPDVRQISIPFTQIQTSDILTDTHFVLTGSGKHPENPSVIRFV